ncbi:MAG: methylisocitrate lyase [Candidatus Bipolaricaulia bacterium]
MAWMVEPVPSQAELAERWKKLVAQGRLIIPGAHDPLAGLLAKRAGFSVLYLSGAALSASYGLPDLGVLTLEEVVRRAERIVHGTGLPVLVDIDTGFGEVLNVVRAARELVGAGVAAVQLEDQEMPKRCGHLSGKRLVPPKTLEQKIRAIKRVCPTLSVVARTDARALEGLDGVIARAQRYLHAGADAIFPEALESLEEFRRVRQAIAAPLLANLTEFGKTPPLTASELFALGYEMVLFPVSALRVAARALERFYAHLAQHGSTKEYLEQMQTRSELYELIHYDAYETFDASISGPSP